MALTPFPISGPILHTPDPSQPLIQVTIGLNPRSGLIETAVSRDGGKTSRVIAGEPPPKTAVGSSPLLRSDLNVGWGAPLTATSAAATTTAAVASYASDSFFVEMVQFGTLLAGQTFGFYQAPADRSVLCSGMQLTLQSAALGSAATFCLVTAQNVESNQLGAINAGVEFNTSLFTAPVLMPAGSQWRTRVKQVGSGDPGECVSVRLILSYPS